MENIKFLKRYKRLKNMVQNTEGVDIPKAMK